MSKINRGRSVTRPQKIAMVGGFRAAYRAAAMARVFMERPSLYTFTCRDPMWYHDARFGRFARRLALARYFVWAIRAVFASDVVLFTPIFELVPPFNLLPHLARTLRKRIIVDFYSSRYDMNIRERSLSFDDSSRANRLRAVDRLSLRSGNPTIFLSDAESAYYTSLLGIESRQVDSAIVPLVSPNRPQADLPYLVGGSTVPTVAWWGRLGGKLHGEDILLESLRLVEEEHGMTIRAALFPSGTPDQIDAFARKASSLPFCDIDIEATMENGHLMDFLRQEADLALGVFGGTESAMVVPTNKIVDAMSMGIPCITGESRAFGEQLEPGTLNFVPHRDAKALAASIYRVLCDREKLKLQSGRVREQWKMHYSPIAFEKSLLSSLEVSDR